MKKKRDSQSMIVPSVKLWLEDVDSIMAILEEYSNSVEVSDRDYEYDSIQDLIAKKGTRPRSLEITSHAPHVSLRFDRREFPNGTWLYASARSPEGEGSYLRIRELLLDRKRWANRLFPPWLALIILTAIVVIPSETLRGWIPDQATRWLVLLSLILYIAIAILLRSGTFYLIALTESHEHESFLARNGERILFLVLGAVTVVIIDWLAGRFLP